MRKLNDMGYKVTQATVSRDIKSLKLVKTPAGSGQYKYTYVHSEQKHSDKFYSILSRAVLSVDYVQNIAVVKCSAGMAQAACASVDNILKDKIVGSLAGDDTIFVLCRSEEAAHEFKEKVEGIIKP